jgi:hypothetical protein
LIPSYFCPGVNFNSEIANMRGPPVSRRFPRRACLSARRVACRAFKGDVGTTRRRPDSAAIDRLATRAADRHCPLLTARIRACHAAVLVDAAVYPVRHAGEYAAPPRSRAVPAALTLSTVVPRRSPPNRHAFPGCLSCAGEVTATAHACCAVARTLAPVELGQAMGRARCAG